MVDVRRMVVRPFGAEDAVATAAVIGETLRISNAADYSADELELLVQWYSAAGLVSRIPFSSRFVATVEGQVVGTAARRENKLEGFFVLPSFQGFGIGQHLLQALIVEAVQLAMRALWLESSLTAVGFYEAMGFVRAGEARDLGDGLVVPMRKALPVPGE